METKKILGLDLGTNSVGWALVEHDFENKKGEIKGLGSRIIPMTQDSLSNFGKGQSHSQTAERTGYRGTRRLYQRDNLRRERLHRVLNILGFLPQHYANSIDFEKRFGQFKKDVDETKINYNKNDEGKYEFLFLDSYLEMLIDFNPNVKKEHLETYCKMGKSKQKKDFKDKHKIKAIPQDWTIYFLRKKALTDKINREELAWLILNFNTKRGYYQERDEKEVEENKREELITSKVVDIIETDSKNKKGTWFEIHLENKLIYKRNTDKPLNEWKEYWEEKEKSFIKTVKIDKYGNTEKDKEGNKRYSLRNVNPEEDWEAIKKKTEQDIEKSRKKVGSYIYNNLLNEPTKKIKGGLIQHIDRKYWRDELKAILETQIELHAELKNRDLYKKCINELYKHNEQHKNNIKDKEFDYLFLDDIIFYHRDLKSKKSTIGGCQYEKENYERTKKTGEKYKQPLKAISKSNPLFIEFRLWQFLHNLKIYEVQGAKDSDITSHCLKNEDEWVALFDFLNDKKDVKQSDIINYFVKENRIEEVKKVEDEKYRWNYVIYTDEKKKTEKLFPVNPTRHQFLTKLKKANVPTEFLSKEIEQNLWHIFYSVTDKKQLEKALKKFAKKNELDEKSFVEHFVKIPKYPSQYGAYSEKAIKKLLPLMRTGYYWAEANVLDKTKKEIDKIIERLKHIDFDEKKIDDSVADDDIPNQVLKSFIPFKDKNPLMGLNTYQACYAVYGRHSEVSEIKQWKSPKCIDKYLKDFKQHSLRNPIVEQLVLETLRTVRDIWKHNLKKDSNFKFDEIHLELGREMKNSADQRKKIANRQSENEKTNKRIYELLKEIKTNTNYKNIKPHSPSQQEKLKLYEEGVYENYNRLNDLESYVEKPVIPLIDGKTLEDKDIENIRKLKSPADTKKNVTKKEIQKYRLWLEQGYISPYTGKIIPLSKLFSREDYEVDHIIPESRYFDDSLNNKVICESAVNDNKKSQLAYSEWLENKGGSIVDLGNNKNVKLLTKEQYKNHCEKYFKNNKTKLKNLLAEEIPDNFIERQINDSRYIAKLIKGLLSNIVREEGEQEATAKELVPVTGAITSKLKQDWGLNDKWNELISERFKRMNDLTGTQDFGYFDKKEDDKGNPTGKEFFRCKIPDNLPKVEKKRIDHRHHALDALVIACCTKDHVNYLNALNAESKNYSLRNKLLIKSKKGDYTKNFKHPWKNFTVNAKDKIEKVIISFKQNLRVINKATNKYWKWQKENGSYKKKLVKQEKGDNWAIRKPLHKETVYGNVKNIPVGKGKIAATVRKNLKDIKASNIDNITNETVKNILKKHVHKYPIYIDDKTKEQKKDKKGNLLYDYEKAFDAEGIDDLNNNIVSLNNNKFHHPIRKVRVYEEGIQFALSENKTNNKSKKYVETAQGTNLFFAIYEKDGKRQYETIPLNEVIEHQKQTARLPKNERTEIPINKENGEFLFSLSPNDLVYVPAEEEQENPNLVDFENLSKEQVKRIFVVNDFSNKICYFTPIHHSKSIHPKEVDLSIDKDKLKGSYPDKTSSFKGNQIKDICWKLKTYRLGNVEVIYPKNA